MLEIETISERENGEYSGYINLYKGISYYHGGWHKKRTFKKAASYFRQSKGLGSILYAPICEGDFSKADLLGLIYSRASLTEGFLIYTDEERARHFLMLAYRNDCISETGAITLNALLRKPEPIKGIGGMLLMLFQVRCNLRKIMHNGKEFSDNTFTTAMG